MFPIFLFTLGEGHHIQGTTAKLTTVTTVNITIHVNELLNCLITILPSWLPVPIRPERLVIDLLFILTGPQVLFPFLSCVYMRARILPVSYC